MDATDLIIKVFTDNIPWKNLLPPLAMSLLATEGLKTKFKRFTKVSSSPWFDPALFCLFSVAYYWWMMPKCSLKGVFVPGIGVGLIAYALDVFFINKFLNKYNQPEVK